MITFWTSTTNFIENVERWNEELPDRPWSVDLVIGYGSLSELVRRLETSPWLSRVLLSKLGDTNVEVGLVSIKW